MKKYKVITKGQTAVEYMMLLAIVMVVVLVGLKSFIPRVNRATNTYFNTVSNAIAGGQVNASFIDTNFIKW